MVIVVKGIKRRRHLILHDIRAHLAQESGCLVVIFGNREKVQHDAVLKTFYRLHQLVIFGTVKHDEASKWWFRLPQAEGRG